jgi:hypothetical protein
LLRRIQVIPLSHVRAAIDLLLHARAASDPVLLRDPVPGLITGRAAVLSPRVDASSLRAAGVASHCAACRGRIVGHNRIATAVSANYSAVGAVCPVMAVSARRNATRVGAGLPGRRQPFQRLTANPSP